MKYLLVLFSFIISVAAVAQDSTLYDAPVQPVSPPAVDTPVQVTRQQPRQNRSNDIDEQAADKSSFHKGNLFTGGSATIALGSGGTVLGVNPVFGYSVSSWLDIGVAINFSYLSLRSYDYYGNLYEKDRQTILGPGAFVKIYPVPFLFIQGQIENNYINDKVIYEQAGTSGSASYSVPSYLTGLGYCGGREPGEIFYYLSVLIDLSNNPESPYLYHSGYDNVIQPIFRAGLQIPLFQGKADKYY